MDFGTIASENDRYFYYATDSLIFKNIVMPVKTASIRMTGLIDLYDMQTNHFVNAIEGISDEAAHQRLNTKANHIAWLAGSIVQQRYEIANQLGIQDKQQAITLFEEGKGIQDGLKYPSLQTFKTDWEKITPMVREKLTTITDEKLDSSFEMMPGMKMTIYELISFFSYREANCIGQIALWRRLLDYPPMKY
jgi:hypothetical protein